MIELFTKDIDEFFSEIIKEFQNEVNLFSNEKIMYTDIEELRTYYIKKLSIQPIQLYIENLNYNFEETKVKRSGGYRSSQDETFIFDGYKITYEIPYDGDNRLLYVRPSRFIMQKFLVDNVNRTTDIEYGKIIFSLDWTKQEMQGIEKPNFAKSNFNQYFKNYIDYFTSINNHVNSFNTRLSNYIKDTLDNRKKKVVDFLELSNKLDIKIVLNSNTPNIKPMPLKKVVKEKSVMPSYKKPEMQCCISDTDYENIKNIISMAGYSLEKTAKTFTQLNEEEIRDFFYANLNTHYQNMTTGETFSKVGKTDLNIQFDNKSAFIAECKIWHGEKQFKEAIEQLFSYTTWRDVKTSIIIFNKENKDFNNLLLTINEYLKKMNYVEK